MLQLDGDVGVAVWAVVVAELVAATASDHCRADQTYHPADTVHTLTTTISTFCRPTAARHRLQMHSTRHIALKAVSE